MIIRVNSTIHTRDTRIDSRAISPISRKKTKSERTILADPSLRAGETHARTPVVVSPFPPPHPPDYPVIRRTLLYSTHAHDHTLTMIPGPLPSQLKPMIASLKPTSRISNAAPIYFGGFTNQPSRAPREPEREIDVNLRTGDQYGDDHVVRPHGYEKVKSRDCVARVRRREKE